MLSEETAMGNFPDEAVAMMTRIAQVTEPNCCSRDLASSLEAANNSDKISMEDLISLSIFFSVEALNPIAVMTPTLSGITSRRLSRFRLPVWIVGVSPNESTCQNLQFSYGVYPVHETVRPTNWEQYARDWLEQHGLTGNLALLTRGTSTAGTGSTNQVEIIDLNRPPGGTSIW
ncbi:pyruvate kinase alpha/beta domain-containing protein [Chloroflexota bacterium]